MIKKCFTEHQWEMKGPARKENRRKKRFFTCRMVKFSRTLFIMYFSGRCFSLWMKLIIYSHIGDRWIRYTHLPFSIRANSVCRKTRRDLSMLNLRIPTQNGKDNQTDYLFVPHRGSIGLTSTFSTTCFPKEHTLVETVMVMFSALLYWLLTP